MFKKCREMIRLATYQYDRSVGLVLALYVGSRGSNPRRVNRDFKIQSNCSFAKQSAFRH